MGNADPAASLRLVLSAAVATGSLGAGAMVAGCRDRGPDRAAASATSSAAPTAAKPADPAKPADGAGHKLELPWMSDDYGGALARARTAKKPLFIDMWAPWCHTCLSMKQFVMNDASLAPYADRFVWLEIDTDKPANAALLTKFGVDVWPTFYVVTPEGEAVQARHLGAASVAQLRELLAQGEAGHQDAMAATGALPADSPIALVRAGDRAAATGDLAAADKAYGQALAAAPDDWPRTADVLVKQIAARQRGGDMAGCADLAMREARRAGEGKTASVTDFAGFADQCLDALDPAQSRLVRGRLSEAVRAVVDAPDAAMSVDDQSDALLRLRELAEGLEDTKLARAMAERQRTLLDRAVASAPSAYGRMIYVWPRSEVYVYLGEGEKLIPEMEKLAADLPNEYDPPYRLAWVNYQVGRLDEALAAAQRAVGMVYGPRKGRALILVADIHKKRGDVAAERAARQAVVDHYASLPPGHKNEGAEAAAREALAAVGKPDPAKSK
jgi:thioredoxin-like negative regulator of GroEL